MNWQNDYDSQFLPDAQAECHSVLTGTDKDRHIVDLSEISWGEEGCPAQNLIDRFERTFCLKASGDNPQEVQK